MKAVSLLQVIYSFFLGLVVVGLVAIGINTFHKRPPWPDYPIEKPNGVDPADMAAFEAARKAAEAAHDAWSLSTSIILLVCATVILAVSLWRPTRMAVISNGLLMGGIFTMVYAVGQSLATDRGGPARFFVALAALAVTVGIGYLTFIRRTPRAVSLTPEEASGETDDALLTRVTELVRRLQALGRALSE